MNVEYKRRESAHMSKMMGSWKGRTVVKEDDYYEVLKSIKKKRMQRKQMKVKIPTDLKCSNFNSDSYMDSDSDQENIYDY